MEIILVARFIRKDHDSKMLFKIDKDHKVLFVLDKNASTHWPIIINPSRIVLFICGFGVESNRFSNPVTVFVLQILDLSVGPIEISKHLNDFSFNLELSLLGH